MGSNVPPSQHPALARILDGFFFGLGATAGVISVVSLILILQFTAEALGK
ncbi:hypothetical protein CH06BL_21240 [Chromobacterium haemolyticum]|nr:hypothetical protein CH06BL_21240 [Chromobacterium haemolyticum]